MILADTSVWVDHLRRSDAALRAALEANEICIHPMVIGEVACGNLRNRTILVNLQLLPQATVATTTKRSRWSSSTNSWDAALGLLTFT